MLGTSEFPGGLSDLQIAGPCPEVPLSVGLGWGLRICLSTTFPGNEDAVGPAAFLGEPLLYAELPCFGGLVAYKAPESPGLRWIWAMKHGHLKLLLILRDSKIAVDK